MTVPTLFFLIFILLSEIFLGIFNSRSLTIACVFSGVLAFPFILAKLHNVRFFAPNLIWSGALVLGLASQPYSYDGNAKLGFLTSMEFWFVGAALVSIALVPLLMKKRL